MATEKTGVVYRIWNRINGKSYVGKSVRPNERIRRHLSGKGGSFALRNAIKKYGKEAFVVEILEPDVPESILSKLEILHIRFFNSKTNGYNCTDGGEGLSGMQFTDTHRQKIAEAKKGQKNSEEARRKISEAHKGRPTWSKGKKFSHEHRQKLSDAGKGRPPWNKGKTGVYSEEARQKMSDAKQGHVPWHKGKTGVYSEEARQKISDAKQGQVPWHKGKTGVYSEEALRKFSKAHKGKKISPETRRKISESVKRYHALKRTVS